MTEDRGLPVLHLDGFDGPVDLLLDLAERQLIDLRRIPLDEAVAQLVDEIRRLPSQPLERRADWLVMASRLVLLRSRLSGLDPDAAAPDPRRVALPDGTVRAAAGWLEVRPQLGQDVFARPQGRNPATESYMALMEACLFVLRGRAGQQEPSTQAAARPVALWRVTEAIAHIRRRLAHAPDGDVLCAYLPPIDNGDPDRGLKVRAAVASSLVAALELARLGEVALDQPESAPVHLRASP